MLHWATRRWVHESLWGRKGHKMSWFSAFKGGGSSQNYQTDAVKIVSRYLTLRQPIIYRIKRQKTGIKSRSTSLFHKK